MAAVQAISFFFLISWVKLGTSEMYFIPVPPVEQKCGKNAEFEKPENLS